MGEGANDVVEPVKCLNCGHDYFTFVKEFTNDTCIERTLRCVKCNTLRVDRECLPPAHAL